MTVGKTVLSLNFHLLKHNWTKNSTCIWTTLDTRQIYHLTPSVIEDRHLPQQAVSIHWQEWAAYSTVCISGISLFRNLTFLNYSPENLGKPPHAHTKFFTAATSWALTQMSQPSSSSGSEFKLCLGKQQVMWMEMKCLKCLFMDYYENWKSMCWQSLYLHFPKTKDELIKEMGY